MGVFGSSSGLVIRGSSSSSGEYWDFGGWGWGGGGGSRVSQCKNNTKLWAYLAAVLVFPSEVLQAALVSRGILGGGGGGGGDSRVSQR